MNLQVWVKQLREVAVVGCAWDGVEWDGEQGVWVSWGAGVSGDKRCHHLHPAGVALEKEMEMGTRMVDKGRGQGQG